jgi:hypothetical protein
MRDERAVRLSADNVGESAATIDPEFPSAGSCYALGHASHFRARSNRAFYETLKRNEIRLNLPFALVYWLSMIFSENRYPLLGIMLY